MGLVRRWRGGRGGDSIDAFVSLTKNKVAIHRFRRSIRHIGTKFPCDTIKGENVGAEKSINSNDVEASVRQLCRTHQIEVCFFNGTAIVSACRSVSTAQLINVSRRAGSGLQRRRDSTRWTLVKRRGILFKKHPPRSFLTNGSRREHCRSKSISIEFRPFPFLPIRSRKKTNERTHASSLVDTSLLFSIGSLVRIATTPKRRLLFETKTFLRSSNGEAHRFDGETKKKNTTAK